MFRVVIKWFRYTAYNKRAHEICSEISDFCVCNCNSVDDIRDFMTVDLCDVVAVIVLDNIIL
jgi:hypothetical protein